VAPKLAATPVNFCATHRKDAASGPWQAAARSRTSLDTSASSEPRTAAVISDSRPSGTSEYACMFEACMATFVAGVRKVQPSENFDPLNSRYCLTFHFLLIQQSPHA
jgi:hypothetical protein